MDVINKRAHTVGVTASTVFVGIASIMLAKVAYALPGAGAPHFNETRALQQQAQQELMRPPAPENKPIKEERRDTSGADGDAERSDAVKGEDWDSFGSGTVRKDAPNQKSQ